MLESLPKILLLLHVGATLFMTGLIWFVQVVHYPLFAHAGREAFSAYEKRHTVLTTWVVGPPMLVEAATAALLLCFPPAGIAIWQVIVGLGLLGAIWLSTALVQVPCHNRLCAEFDAAVHGRLVSSNWIRTACWSARGGLVLWMTFNGLA